MSWKCPQCELVNATENAVCRRCNAPQFNQSYAGVAPTPYPGNAPPAHMPMPYPQPIGFSCPYCGSQILLTKDKVSNAGWFTLIALIFLCLPLFWIGLFIREEYKQCGGCGIKLG